MRREADTRKVRKQQREFGDIRFEDTALDLKSWDESLAQLPTLQHLCADEAFCPQVIALLNEHTLPGVGRRVGRRGIEVW